MRLRLCRIASADPENQRLPRRCCAGTEATYEFSRPFMRQVCEMWRSRLCDLYCVSTTICLRPEFSRFDRAKSMSRYCPPNGTAGLARSSVRGMSRLPSPPASTMPNTLRVAMDPSVVRRRAISGVDVSPCRMRHVLRYRGSMRVDLLTREYPPEVYGGAGVHVAELVRALRRDLDVIVRCFGAPRDEPGTIGYATPAEFDGRNAALGTMGVDLLMAGDAAGADLVHSHTWYANFAGFTAKRLHGMPHVVTAHSLEPLRPWKAEQLGGGYRLSSWVEHSAFADADAVIAVSDGMRRDILRSYPDLDPARVEVVYNGIDLADWAPSHDADAVRALGVDPDRPSIVFVGRITRQKGLPYLLRAARMLPADVQLVLCAGAPDTPEIMAEVEGLVDGLRRERDGVVWIDRHL